MNPTSSSSSSSLSTTTTNIHSRNDRRMMNVLLPPPSPISFIMSTEPPLSSSSSSSRFTHIESMLLPTTSTNSMESNESPFFMNERPSSCDIPPTTKDQRNYFEIVQERQRCFQLLCSKEQQLLALVSLHSSSQDLTKSQFTQTDLRISALRKMSSIPDTPKFND